MVDPKAFLKAALQLHGHECPDLILGLRAGAAAMNRLGVERSAEGQLLALVQFPQGRRCFADGVQAITGCTLGKGNVRVEGQGPLSLTLVEQATRRAVRVAPRVDLPQPPLPVEAAEALLRRLLTVPERQVLSVGEEYRIDEELTGVKAGERAGV
jgi:formylmethanofuran dehydrogenase subunit E